MGEAAAFAHNAASTYSYQNYTLFALTAGYNASILSKGIDSKTTIESAKDKIVSDGDVYAGAAANVALNLGINLTLIKKILGFDGDNAVYANIKYGYLNTDRELMGCSINSYFYGIGLSYQLIGSVDFIMGSWRGIALNTGFYVSKQKSKMSLDYTPVSYGGFVFSPEVSIKSDAKVYTVPAELTTAFSLFFLNVSAGGGADFVFGKCGSSIDMSSAVMNSSGGIAGFAALSNADVTGVSPTRISPKLMGGIGLQVAIIKFDIPVSYYIKQKALTVGLTAGLIF